MRFALCAVFCVIALMAAGGGARAEGAACPSIVQNDGDCAPLPRVTAKGDMRVEVVTRKRELSFRLVPGRKYDEDYSAESCPGGKCACNEYVQYLDFKGPVPGYRQVNAIERTAAKKAKCSIENSNIDRSIRHFAVSAHFISTAVYELEYCRNCGGSCHGHTALTTYDATSGKALRLRDVLKVGGEALVQQLAADFVQANVDVSERERVRANLIAELAARRPLIDEGFYVENGVVYANIDSFIMSCADGSFFPVAVSAASIDPAFAALLKP